MERGCAPIAPPTQLYSSSTRIAAPHPAACGESPVWCLLSELHPKLSVERLCVIAHHVQSAALLGTLRPEGAHDNVTTWPDSIDYGLNILAAFGPIDEEMEHCAIVPHIERLKWQGNLSDISDQPSSPRISSRTSFQFFPSGNPLDKRILQVNDLKSSIAYFYRR